MNIFKKIGQGIAKWGPVAAGVADVFGVPYAGTIGSIIQEAQARGGTGRERGEYALSRALEEAPAVIASLEKRFGKNIPVQAASDYIRAQVQAHYDLMKAIGEI